MKTKEAAEGRGRPNRPGKAADKTSSAGQRRGQARRHVGHDPREGRLLEREIARDTAIDVVTTDRVVTLRGTVASIAAKDRAAEIAGGIDGVTRVVNLLLVKAT